MIKFAEIIFLAVISFAFANAANASVLYKNAPLLTYGQIGNCFYNTACSPNNVNVYGAQEFMLNQNATVTGGGWNSILTNGAGYGSSVNYELLKADGAGGLPSTVITYGNSNLSYSAGPSGAQWSTVDYAYDITPISLTAGSYYLAINEVTNYYSDYLSLGVATSGAAQYNYGNNSQWSFGYGNGLQSVAMTVTGTFNNPASVPEPASWLMLLTGLGMFFPLYRRHARAQRKGADWNMGLV